MSRPKLPKRKPSKSVTLEDDQIRFATRIGNGNLSAGISICILHYKAEKQREKEREKMAKERESDNTAAM